MSAEGLFRVVADGRRLQDVEHRPGNAPLAQRADRGEGDGGTALIDDRPKSDDTSSTLIRKE